MPPRDEETRFEQLLARHLRRGGANAGCPDAQTLAAYHERALTAEEMDAFKGHITACGRCQEVLAGLEASEEVAAWEKVGARTATAALAGRRHAAAINAAPMPRAAAAQEKRREPKRIWKWAAPAAAVAAGILVWVAVREAPRAPRETTVALNKQPAEAGRASPELKAQATAPSADQRGRMAQTQAQPALPASTPPASRSGAHKEADELTAQLSGPNQKLYDKLPRQDENARGQQYAYAEGAKSQSLALKKQPAAPAQESQKAPAPPPAPITAESAKKDAEQQFAMGNAGAAGQLGATDKTKRATQEEPQKQVLGDEAVAVTAAGAAETKTIGTPGGRKNEKLQRLAKPAAEPRAAAALRDSAALFTKDTVGLVLTPEKSVMWRVGAAGMILKTFDGGSSWIRQTSGVNVDLLAGSAPSESVCWVVGRDGTILRTTDGEHWQGIASPTKTDLIGIDARDAQTAVISTSERPPKYVTRDGGKTWQPLAN